MMPDDVVNTILPNCTKHKLVKPPCYSLRSMIQPDEALITTSWRVRHFSDDESARLLCERRAMRSHVIASISSDVDQSLTSSVLCCSFLKEPASQVELDDNFL